VIIRRPHAYLFLQQKFEESMKFYAPSGANEGGIVDITLVHPIPGFYLLDAEGRVLGHVGLESQEEVMALLRQAISAPVGENQR